MIIIILLTMAVKNPGTSTARYFKLTILNCKCTRINYKRYIEESEEIRFGILSG